MTHVLLKHMATHLDDSPMLIFIFSLLRLLRLLRLDYNHLQLRTSDASWKESQMTSHFHHADRRAAVDPHPPKVLAPPSSYSVVLCTGTRAHGHTGTRAHRVQRSAEVGLLDAPILQRPPPL